MAKYIEDLDTFIHQHDLQIVIFKTRYEDEPFAAYLAQSDGEDCISVTLTGSDDSWMPIQHMCHFDWYPYATGHDIVSTIHKLQRKMAYYFNEPGWTGAFESLSGTQIHNVERIEQIQGFEHYHPGMGSRIRDFFQKEGL